MNLTLFSGTGATTFIFFRWVPDFFCKSSLDRKSSNPGFPKNDCDACMQSGEVVQSKSQLPHRCWGSFALRICLLVHLFWTRPSRCSPRCPVQCTYRNIRKAALFNITPSPQFRQLSFSLGYTLCFAVILAKTWRVYHIFSNPAPKKMVRNHCTSLELLLEYCRR